MPSSSGSERHDRWAAVPFDPDKAPSSVLADFAVSRLIAKAWEQLGEGASASTFLSRLEPSAVDDPARLRSFQRTLAGERTLGLSEFLEWCHAFGVVPADLLGEGLRDRAKYPPLYRAALHLSSSGGSPVFRSPRRVDWPTAARLLNDALEEQAQSIGAQFVSLDVVIEHLARGLVDAGVSKDLIRRSGTGMTILLAQPIVVEARVGANGEEDWIAMHEAVVRPSCQTLLIVADATTRARLETAFPGLVELKNGETYEVPTHAYEAHQDADPLQIATWTRVAGVSGTLFETIVLTLK